MPAPRSVVSVLLRRWETFLYTLKAGPAGGLRPPSGPATTRWSPDEPALPSIPGRATTVASEPHQLGSGYNPNFKLTVTHWVALMPRDNGNSRWKVWAGLFVAVAPVVLGTLIQLADKASAPLWLLLFLIAIGGVLAVVSTVRNARESEKNKLSSGLREGERAPGILEVSDIQVLYDDQAYTATLDLRLSNRGGSTILINKVVFEVLDVEILLTTGFLEFSHTYDLDISDLKNIGDKAECSTSQEINPGEVDRFAIILMARRMDMGEHRWWKLSPTLYSNTGIITGPPIEVWLPSPLGEPGSDAYRGLESDKGIDNDSR
jgi:hypothetical protein